MSKQHLLKKIIFEQLILLTIAFVPYFDGAAILNAQTMPQGTDFFTEALSVSRGKITPMSQTGEVWMQSYYCSIVKSEWGWDDCNGIDAFIVGMNSDIDTLIVSTPDSEGLVKFDDWKDGDLKEEISAIEASLSENLREQSKIAGQTIEFRNWRVYPTLDEEKKIMYYATDIAWGNEVSTNVKATVFDRYGYVSFLIMPSSADLDADGVRRVVLDAISHYTPNPSADYSSFASGDKVAAVGAVGVLATLIGVKYTKTALAGVFAIVLVLLKKAWLIVLLPFFAIKKYLSRNKNNS